MRQLQPAPPPAHRAAGAPRAPAPTFLPNRSKNKYKLNFPFVYCQNNRKSTTIALKKKSHQSRKKLKLQITNWDSKEKLISVGLTSNGVSL
jgi:hypothetical protein